MTTQSTRLKVVLHCDVSEGPDDYIYGVNGHIHQSIEQALGEPIDLVPFHGYLSGAKLDELLRVAEDTDVFIFDAWTHPEDGGRTFKNPHEEMREVVLRVCQKNPEAPIFAELMEGTYEVAVHSLAIPFPSYSDIDPFLPALELARLLKRERDEDEPLAEVLVVDDQREHLRAAREQFAGRTLLTTSSYLEAISLLEEHRFGAVMTDLMMPADKRNQGPKGEGYVGQLMPMGSFVAAKALEVGVPNIVVVSDTGHHDHPAGHVAELMSFNVKGPIRWFCGDKCRFVEGGAKDWATILSF